MVSFFSVVRLYPNYAVVVLWAVVVLSLVTLWLNPRELDSGLGMILFVQMFLASTGFAVRARRGHFDPLLTSGSDRVTVAVAHWTVSILPGAAAWALVAAMGYILGSPAAVSALAGTRLVAFLIVSAVAWAVGFLLPGGTAGALWIGILIALLTRNADLLAASDSTASGIRVLQQAATLILCPFLLIGTHPPIGSTAAVAAICLTAALLLSVWRFAAGLDIPLVDRT